jgi:hypothetical protein
MKWLTLASAYIPIDQFLEKVVYNLEEPFYSAIMSTVKKEPFYSHYPDNCLIV